MNGTASTEHKNNFTASEICAIIKACSKANVSRISLDGLVVDFSKESAPAGLAQYGLFSSEQQGPVPGFGEGMPLVDSIESLDTSDSLSEDDKDLAETARLSQLMTDDPLSYEQEVIDAMLEPTTLRLARD